MQCHRKQGYKVGDVRGGISVRFDIRSERATLEQMRDRLYANIAFLSLAGAALLGAMVLYGRIRASDEAKISELNATLAYQVRALDAFNATLHQRVDEEVAKRREGEHLLIQQSKLAAIGEMIGNIAHQWRQPIAAVSAILLNIKYSALAQGMEADFLNERMREAEGQLRYMSQTIEDFRTFFKPDKESEAFDVAQECHRAYKIIQAVLNEHGIDLQRFSKPHMIAWGYPSAFAQVVLNILSNAKDVLIERKVAQPRIEIHIEREEGWIVCTISENGGGIDEAVLERIFEPYFTTKAQNGTGIGLYIAQEIIHKHMRGSLSAYNTPSGAAFKIMIPQGERHV
ncbi:MAG: HAMP domain-containing histidine kinase [Campylobacterales bacterium]|nr:HAMP domain-containing histidine kinase [Campylobacterales bacterium]